MRMTSKPYKGLPMEGVIATWYARNTKGDLSTFRSIAAALTSGLAAGARVLEVAPGPGYLAVEIARRGDVRVSAVDISESFVRMARDNAAAAGVALECRRGNALQLPYPDASFDLVVCRAAFKNFTDPLGALNEAHRVLVPGGRAVIYDLRKEATREQIDAAVDEMLLSPVNTLLTKLVFRTTLLKNAYTTEALQRLVAQSRFGGGELSKDNIGFELRLTKAIS